MFKFLPESESKIGKVRKSKGHCNDKGSFIGKTLLRDMIPGIRSGVTWQVQQERRVKQWCIIRVVTTLEN